MLRQHPGNERRELGRQVRREVLRVRRRLVQVCGDDIPHALEDKRPSATGDLEQDAAERVDIRSRVGDARAAALLGRHVVRCPHDQARARRLDAGEPRFTGELGDPEVEDLHALAAGHLRIGDEEQVGGLEIAMRDAGGMRCLQDIRDLAPDPAARGRVVSRLAKPRPEGLALEHLHHEVRAAIRGRAEVEHLNDAGAADRRRGARFVEEPPYHVGLAGQLGLQHLHDHAMAQSLVAADVDDAHTPLAELLHDPIVAEQRPQHAMSQSTADHQLSSWLVMLDEWTTRGGAAKRFNRCRHNTTESLHRR